MSYPRGSLRERLAAWEELRRAIEGTGALVVDSDSRLTQLGLLPVCPEEDYYFFESRAYGGEGGEALPELARRWCAETFGVPGAAPYIAVPGGGERAEIAVSLGVGGNAAKRIADPFEARLLERLAATGASVCVDRGGGGEEAARVERAAAGLNRVRLWEGSFAGFRGHHRWQPALRGLRFGGPARGGRLRRPVGLRLCRIPHAAHVRPLAANGAGADRYRAGGGSGPRARPGRATCHLTSHRP